MVNGFGQDCNFINKCGESPLSSTPIGCDRDTSSTSHEISSVDKSDPGPSSLLICDDYGSDTVDSNSPLAKTSLQFQTPSDVRRSPRKHKLPSCSSSMVSPKKRKTKVFSIITKILIWQSVKKLTMIHNYLVVCL